MGKLLAVVKAGEESVTGVLAGEALRNAAAKAGRAIEVEVRTKEGTLHPLGTGEGADALLLVGGAEDPRFPALPRRRAAIEDVLADPAAVLAGAPAQGPQGPAAAPGPAARIVAVTSCPTGIAHTFMAAEGITQAAAALGVEAAVETQGSVGAGNTLAPAQIAAADVVLIAADRQVDLSRFAGKRIFETGTKQAISDGQGLIRRALAEAAVKSGQKKEAAQAEAANRAGPYRHLMTGVSFMLPFVTAGGILIALAFAFGGIYAFDEAHQGTFANALFQIGSKAAFTLIVPVLAGYIAFSIADRPGIAPGMIGGLLAVNINAGFIGGILAGFVGGYGTYWMNRLIRLPRTLEGLKPVLILPLLGTLLTGLLMIYAIGTPVAQLLAFLTDWLKSMQGSSAILLGLLLGAMMAFDMGGPVNKAAYAFSTALIASQVYTPMAASMAAGMTPPLALALATKLFPSRFTHDEREAGNATAILGLAFISEGAIPFAARDPLRVIPCLMAGSAVAGAISMAVGAELKVPHGGIFVLPIPNVVTHLGGYVAALVAGTAVSGLALGLVKRRAAVPAPAIAAEGASAGQ